MNIYRGDTFSLDIGATDENGAVFEFNPEDILKIGVKESLTSTEYVLFKEITINEKTDTVNVQFPCTKMKECSIGKKILEVELTEKSGVVTTIYQEEFEVLGDVNQ